MEVLQGNQSGSKHSRRRLDRIALGENRALDWGHQESDIGLQCVSPLELADILAQSNGFLDLIPLSASNEAAEPSSDGNTASSTTACATACATDRCNLHTVHDSTDLLQRCKKILVENALIKDKGDRQLYLAAGFISWPDAANANARQRAPLLLYPALLVRIPDEQNYEIRLTGDSPEYNQTLIIHAEQRFGVKLPAQEDPLALSSFFDEVAEAIREVPTLQLELDTCLGSAALLVPTQRSADNVSLPDVPMNFDVGLAMSITGKKSLQQLSAVLQLIPDYNQVDAPSTPEPAPLPSSPSIASLRKYAVRLAAEGLDHVEFRQLTTLPDVIGKWTSAVSTALDCETIKTVLRMPELSARELIRLAGIIELIDKAPNNIESLGHADLCYANSTILLRRARHQAKLIEDELTGLQEHFVMDKVPGKSQLLSLLSELSVTVERGPELVDSTYFNARRQFMEFSIHKSAHLTAEHRRLLSQLAKVMRFRELFVNNTEYRAALGPGYRGLRTDWDVLTHTCEYARELADVLQSETLASQILRNWTAFRAAYSVELELLQNAAEACRRLLGTVGTRWQTQTAASLTVHAQLIASRLTEWRTTYGSMDNHADKTPAMVLSSFSGRSHDDILVETQVDETRTRINRQLQDGEIRREQITDTLKWLLAASQAATDHDLDIDAIVEHLQIA
ncbi:DUF4011 domain-containing protein [Granulosicoccus antarcticus]|uniref:Uncharacterized protein n=1 Tax=Granulosicoccus antarcticus IMCC3135 TaxID=1192854 RepID=A0A2Z2NY65_9GAMM|nr:DUF4011 domain-containing protein [Granulosicoccus antarcticus]ASJ74891.1 hypothetical protein IMCC3135_24110 [Granulosicoccus antarcticus IMCC3135]